MAWKETTSHEQATSQAVQNISQQFKKEVGTALSQEFHVKAAPVDQAFLRSENGATFLMQIAMAQNEQELERIVGNYVPPFNQARQERMLEFARQNHDKIRASSGTYV